MGRKPVFSATEKALILSKAYSDAKIAEMIGIPAHRVRALRYDWNTGRAVGNSTIENEDIDLVDTDEL